MDVKVTLARQIEQYLDIFVKDVDSPEQATERVMAQLSTNSSAARLLQDKKWFGEVPVDQGEPDFPQGHIWIDSTAETK